MRRARSPSESYVCGASCVTTARICSASASISLARTVSLAARSHAASRSAQSAAVYASTCSGR